MIQFFSLIWSGVCIALDLIIWFVIVVIVRDCSMRYWLAITFVNILLSSDIFMLMLILLLPRWPFPSMFIYSDGWIGWSSNFTCLRSHNRMCSGSRIRSTLHLSDIAIQEIYHKISMSFSHVLKINNPFLKQQVAFLWIFNESEETFEPIPIIRRKPVALKNTCK